VLNNLDRETGKLANVDYMSAVLINDFCHIYSFQLQEYNYFISK